MRIKQKLETFFLVLFFLFLLVSFVSLNVQRKITTNIEKYAEEFVPGINAMNRIEGELYRAAEFAKRYALAGHPEHKTKSLTSLCGIKKYKAIHKVYHIHIENIDFLQKLDAKTEDFIIRSMEYLGLKEKGGGEEELQIVEAKLDQEIYALASLIHKKIIENTEKRKRITKDLAQKSVNAFYIILGSIALFILIGIIASNVTVYSISNPVKRLTDSIKALGTGKLDIKIDHRLKETKDEIGEFALAFDKMTKDLREITVSKEELEKEVDERQKTEEALRKSEEMFKTLAENSPDLIMRLDRELHYLYVSPKVESITGKPANFFVGKTYKESDTSGIICENLAKSYLKVFQTGKLEIVESSIKIQKKDMHFQFVIVPEFSDNGSVETVLAIARDITKLKEAEKILKKDKKDIERLVEERTRELVRTQKKLADTKRLSDIGALSATVAHELRNPLAIIRTALYNIKRKRQNPSIDKHLASIDRHVLESNQIINNLLFYSRIKLPHCEDLNIYSLLNECVTFVKERFTRKQPSIHQEFNSIKNIFIEADPLQIKELFVNILNNAYDSLPDNDGIIETGAKYNPDSFIEVYFKDNGSGIEKKDLKRVYEPFFSTKSRGTGLGLTVCQQIANLHCGKIDIKSKKNQGTTVRVILPIKKSYNAQNAALLKN